MKLSASLGLIQDIWGTIGIAIVPTLWAIWRSPTLLLHPQDISRVFFSYVWVPFGDGIDENSRPVKQSLIPEYAHGVVLDIGAG